MRGTIAAKGRAMLELNILASGSSGNAAIVRDGGTGRCVLIDCGICKRDFFARCEELGVDPRAIEATLVTHVHSDHTSGLGVVMRGLAKEGCTPPLYAHPLVREASPKIREVEPLVEQRELHPGKPVHIAGMCVLPFATSHDVASSVGFRFEVEGDALGYATDTGFVTPEAHEALGDVRILAIESNHDVIMLREGPYPYVLQQRILSDEGHLSNAQCCTEVELLLHPGLEHVVAMHISEHNNTFGLPVRELQKVLDANNHPAQVHAGLPRTPVAVR